MKIIIAGGSGFIGQYLESRFLEHGHQVFILTRKPKKENDIEWDGRSIGSWTTSLENADVLLNFSGKSVDCRYNEKNKILISDSRIQSTRILQVAIEKCSNPLKLWVNSSTATIYRHSEDRPMTERDGEIGVGFSVDVATNWEKEFYTGNLEETRKVALRLSITLGQNGGAFPRYKHLAQFGLGGKHGNGKQMISWVHIEDLNRVIEFIIINKKICGTLNVSSPNPVSNYSFMRRIRNELKIPIGVASPKWLLEIGAFFLRTETELLLKSRWVIPERLENYGFKFKFPTIDMTIKDLIH